MLCWDRSVTKGRRKRLEAEFDQQNYVQMY
jgi:hypothetical protein